MVDWWSETEHAVVECLGSAGPLSPQDLAHRVGISEGEAISFLCMLVREKKVAIRLVGLTDTSASRPARGVGRHRDEGSVGQAPAFAGGR